MKIIKQTTKYSLLFFIVSIFGMNGVYSQFAHPSVRNTQQQLDLLKDRVNNNPNSLNAKYWNSFINHMYAKETYVPKAYATVVGDNTVENPGELHLHGDAQAAYANAIQWVVTGDAKYKQKSILILNDWADTFVSFTPKAQDQLESAWSAPNWAAAADIIRYYNNGAAGWSTNAIAKFDIFLNKLYLEAEKSKDRTQNWGSSAANAMISVGAYQGNKTKFDAGIAAYKFNFEAVSRANGQIVEVCRDDNHPQFCLIAWQDASETAWHNGVDLYGIKFGNESKPRLAIVLDYFAELFNGTKTHPCAANWAYNYVGAQKMQSGYEIAYNHYVNRKGAKSMIPNYARMVETNWRTGRVDKHFVAWTTVTHGDISKGVASNVASASIISPQEGSIVAAGTTLFVEGTTTVDPSKITSVSLFINTSLVRTLTAAPFKWGYDSTKDAALINLSAGAYVLKMVVTDNANVKTEDSINITCKAQIAQTPFKDTFVEVPGIIEAEDYDKGGEGISYADNTVGNDGSVYRPDNVDIVAGNNGFYINNNSVGEWREYSINVAETAQYDFEFLYSSKLETGVISAEFFDESIDVIPDFVMPQTSPDNWTTFKTITKSNVQMTKGQHVLRFNIVERGFNFDKVTIKKVVLSSTDFSTLTSNELKVFPNSSKTGIFQLSKKGTWKVFNLAGVLLLEGSENIVDLSRFSKAVYILKFNAETKKLIYH